MFKVILQCLLILLPSIVSIFYPLQKIAYGFFALLTMDTKILDNALKSITSNEKIISIICGIIFSVILYLWRKKVNTDKLFNTGNSYHNYPLYIYWIASKILGYGKVTLVRVPIHLQYKLIITDLFPNISVDNDVEKKEETVMV